MLQNCCGLGLGSCMPATRSEELEDAHCALYATCCCGSTAPLSRCQLSFPLYLVQLKCHDMQPQGHCLVLVLCICNIACASHIELAQTAWMMGIVCSSSGAFLHLSCDIGRLALSAWHTSVTFKVMDPATCVGNHSECSLLSRRRELASPVECSKVPCVMLCWRYWLWCASRALRW